MFRFMIVFLTMIGNFYDIGNTHVCVNEVISQKLDFRINFCEWVQKQNVAFFV